MTSLEGHLLAHCSLLHLILTFLPAGDKTTDLMGEHDSPGRACSDVVGEQLEPLWLPWTKQAMQAFACWQDR